MRIGATRMPPQALGIGGRQYHDVILVISAFPDKRRRQIDRDPWSAQPRDGAVVWVNPRLLPNMIDRERNVCASRAPR